jgi:serine/threonine-protein kinase
LRADPLIGQSLAGKYRIGEKIGSGGMSSIYLAEHLGLGKTVALKVMHDHLITSPEVLERFQYEARAASRIQHPNVVSVLDFGTDAGTTYLVMEYVRGVSLEQALEKEGRLPVPRAVELMRQVMAALVEAHALGVIHRDLKPANLLLTAFRDGREHVKVTDFGIAKLLDDNRKLTEQGSVCGTPGYMAPELLLGEDKLDGAVDVYAAALVLFELIAGAAPFGGGSRMKVAMRHLAEVAPRLSSVVPDAAISPVLDQLVVRALAKEPAARPSAAEMRAVLDGLAEPTSEVPARVTSPLPRASQLFVGRAAELTRVTEALGHPASLVRIRGADGSGRRSLAKEAIRILRSRGLGTVLQVTPAGMAPATPLLSATSLVSAMSFSPAASGDVSGDVDDYCRRIVELDAAHGGTLIVIEDAERLDRASLNVLDHYLAEPTRRARVLITESQRPVLEKVPGEHVVVLPPLGYRDAESLWQREAGGAAAPAWLLETGHPLLVVLGARLKAKSPGTLDELVAHYLAQAPPATSALLLSCAALGDRSQKSVALAVAGNAGQAALPAALADGLLCDDGDELALVHSAVRDVLVSAMTQAERGRWHGAVLDALPADAPALVFAHHARLAGRVEQAAFYEEQAGDQAESQGGSRRTLEAWWRSVEMLRLCDPSEPDVGEAWLRVSQKLALALCGTGQAALARTVMREAILAISPTLAGAKEALLSLATQAVESADGLLGAELIEHACRHGAGTARQILELSAQVALELERGDKKARILTFLDEVARRLGGLPGELELVRVRVWLKRGQLREAEEAALRVASWPKSSDALSVRALCLAAAALKQGRNATRALDLLERALEKTVSAALPTDTATVLDELVSVCRQLGDDARAARYAQAAARVAVPRPSGPGGP